MQTISVKQDIPGTEILTEIKGRIGLITLTRPKALNALNISMIQTITEALQAWEKDLTIEFVIIHSNDAKAFCAGGDIRAVYMARVQDDYSFSDSIFRKEYELNYYISQYPKPYVALIDGVCMGGGLGISVHGSHRIATERSVFAMPETAIGFFPDIGASYFLNKCPGEIGTFLGLVGDKISGSDAFYAGIATHYVPSSKLEDLKQTLFKAQSKQEALEIIEFFHEKPEDSLIEQHRKLIDTCFAQKNIEDIINQLEDYPSKETAKWLSLIDKRSPSSLKITLKLLQNNKEKSLKECLPIEFRLSQRFVKKYDFIEGIRALLIDKDNQPSWQPRLLTQVTPDQIEEYFKPLEDKELSLS